MINQFTPTVYLIANVSTEDPKALLEKLTEEFSDAYGLADSYYVVDEHVIAFVNQHPDSGELLIEIQALTVEDSVRGVEAATKIVSSVSEITLSWIDVSREAMSYHANKPSETEE
jgi:hypothetical protein